MVTQTLGTSFQYSYTIGRNDNAGTGFTRPVDLVRGPEDLIYVLNRGYEALPLGRHVTVCTTGEDYVGQFGRGATVGQTADPDADGSIVWPTSIAMDHESNVYVADEALNRISIFSKDGDWIGKWGTPGERDGEFKGPSGLAFGEDDNLVLVDSLNHRIQKFTKDGNFLAKWGGAGTGEGEFNMPWGIEIDSVGDVYVADWRNDRVQKFSPQGEFLMMFGTSGSKEGELNRPTDIAIDKDGIVYVTDWGNDRLKVFGPDGSYITTITGNGSISKWAKEKLDANPEMWEQRDIAQGLERERQLRAPVAVEVDNDNRIFILESGSHRMQIFRKIPPYFTGIRL